MGSVGNDQCVVSVPKAFCWTKFGDEAGESMHSIFRRKEVERQRSDGVFLWGIGQSIRPSLLRLLRLDSAPKVLFSPMKCAPAHRDISPSSIVVWCEGLGLDGQPYCLPEHSLVTSRRDDKFPRNYHYALVCECSAPITPQGNGAPNLRSGSLRNLVSGSTVGSSQVTSVVQRTEDVEGSGPEYAVTATGRLVAPYLVRLTRGVVVPNAGQYGRLSRTQPGWAIDDLLRLRRDEADAGHRIGATANVLW